MSHPSITDVTRLPFPWFLRIASFPPPIVSLIKSEQRRRDCDSRTVYTSEVEWNGEKFIRNRGDSQFARMVLQSMQNDSSVQKLLSLIATSYQRCSISQPLSVIAASDTRTDMRRRYIQFSRTRGERRNLSLKIFPYCYQFIRNVRNFNEGEINERIPFRVYEQQESWREINERTILRLWTLQLNYSVRKINESVFGERVSSFWKYSRLVLSKEKRNSNFGAGEEKEKLNLSTDTSEQSTVLLLREVVYRLVAAARSVCGLRLTILNAINYDGDVSIW